MSRGKDNGDCEVKESVLVDYTISGRGSLQTHPESSIRGLARLKSALQPQSLIYQSLVRICDKDIIALFNSLVKSHDSLFLVPAEHGVESNCLQSIAPLRNSVN